MRRASIDALFIPEQADGMPALATALATSGVKTQILGTGVWNDPRVLRLPALQGAWFAAPDNAGFNAFAAALQGAIQRRSAAARVALLRRRVAGGGAGARARGATLFAEPC